MHRRVIVPAILMMLAALLLGGCASSRPAKVAATTPVPPPPPVKDAPLSKEEQEVRAEALAHYGTGVSYELRGEAEKALEEYYLSALADPANENFVLDVARRLIKQKKPGKAVEILSKTAALPESSGIVDALLGVAYAQDGKKDLAIAASQKAIHKSPNDLQGYQNLFHLHLQSNQPREALKALDDAAKVNSDDFNFLIDLAGLYIEYVRTQPGEMEKIKPRMASTLQAAAKLKPENPGVMLRLAEKYLQSDLHDEAFKVLDDAARANSTDPGFLIDLADLYVSFVRAKAGELEKIKPRVIALLETIAKLKTDNPLLTQRMAENYLGVGEFQKGAELFSTLLKQFANQPAIRDRLRARLTDVYIQSGDRKKAAEQLEAIIQNDPANPQAYFMLAGIYHDAEEYGKAEQYYEKVISLNPDIEAAYYDLAMTKIAQKKPEESLEVLKRAGLKFKQNFVAEFYTALAYNTLKDYSQGIKHLTAAEVVAKTSEPSRLTHLFYFQLGSTYERNKDFEQAEKSFQDCLKLDPDFAEALNYLGYMWAERGVKLDQALPLIEKAVKLEPDNGAFLDSLAWVLFKLGKPREALGHMRKAIAKTDKPDATLFDHLGDIYAALKQMNEARDAWKKAISLEPSEEIQRKLDGGSLKSTP